MDFGSVSIRDTELIIKQGKIDGRDTPYLAGNVTHITMPIGKIDMDGNKEVEIVVMNNISFIKRCQMIHEIVEGICFDDKYHYGLDNFMINLKILEYYTNFKIAEMKTEVINQLISCTDIMDRVSKVLGSTYDLIYTEATSAIEYRKSEIQKTNQINQMFEKISDLSKNIGGLLEKFLSIPTVDDIKNDKEFGEFINVSKDIIEYSPESIAKAMLSQKLEQESSLKDDES